MALNVSMSQKIQRLIAMASKTPLTYKDAGVDIHAGNQLVERIKPAVSRTLRPEVLGGLGGFGGLFQLSERYNQPVLVSGTDGVGTKLMLAQTANKFDTIGIDLVAMCVNDILVCGAEPLFFLDYFACGSLCIDQASQVVEGIATGCEQAHCALIGGETAEMPGLYDPGEFDLAGFSVGVVERQELISGDAIESGDVMIALSSSGPHSNGYSLIRKVLEQEAHPENVFVNDVPVIEALLKPTEIYVSVVQTLLNQPNHPIRGMAHITGGGLTENIVRILPSELAIEIDTQSWTTPPVFQWLMDQGQIPIEEMRRTFNMGIGFVIICPDHDASRLVAQITKDSHLDAWVMGRVVESEDQSRVRYRDE